MKKTIVVLATAVLLMATFAGAASAPTDMEKQISEKLVQVFGDDAKAIKVTLFEGQATLIGRVAERSTQELAEEVALYFPEVKKVDNQLKSASDRSLLNGQLSDETEDAKLETLVKHAVEGEIGSHVRQIEVEAAAHVVSLRGTVPDETRRKFAIDSAARVKGVRRVIDLLRVKS